MTWRYTFDDGPEKTLDTDQTLYDVVAMLAFSREKLTRFPEIVLGVAPYNGHVLKLWDDRLAPDHYGPYRYGLGFNQCVALQIVHIN